MSPSGLQKPPFNQAFDELNLVFLTGEPAQGRALVFYCKSYMILGGKEYKNDGLYPFNEISLVSGDSVELSNESKFNK